ncbi:MAG: hypothetical protein FH751_11375 [Firmicutes bacterium]|nr:hypothetical protein [Bacillota bacterium]
MDRGQIMSLILFFIMFIGILIPIYIIFIRTLNTKNTFDWKKKAFHKNKESLGYTVYTPGNHKFICTYCIIIITICIIAMFIKLT